MQKDYFKQIKVHSIKLSVLRITKTSNNNNNNNNYYYYYFYYYYYNYIMTTPLMGLFSVMLKSPSLLVKNPNW